MENEERKIERKDYSILLQKAGRHARFWKQLRSPESGKIVYR